MYFIIEIQGHADGSFVHAVTQKADRNEAEAVYHNILQYAALSTLPIHAAAILTETGQVVRNECYTHEAVIEQAPEE